MISFKDIIKSTLFNTIIIKSDALVVSIISIAFGYELMKNPSIVNYSQTYEIVSSVSSSRIFGILFIVWGISKIVAIIMNLKYLKIISIACIVGLWVFFGVSVIQSGAPNTVYIHFFGWAAIGIGVSVREWHD